MENKNDIFSLITDSPNRKVEMLNRMRNSSLPILIYGIGGYAKGLIRFLANYGIKINAAVVDKKFYTKDLSNLNMPLYPLEDIRLYYKSYNILIGFADFVKAEENLRALNGCRDVYFLDSTLCMDFFDYAYVKKNWDAFYFTYRLLGDELSRKTMIAFINAKISSYPKDLYELVKDNQYFPDELFFFNDNEIFVDAGAYTGDTILKFIEKVNDRYNRIYALEPDIKSYNKLYNLVKLKSYHNVEIYNKGVWKDSGSIYFNIDNEIGARSSIAETGSETIDVVSIDNIVADNIATFIKADVEGAELAALQGAERTIVKSKPKLAISMYHKPEDLITIPQYLTHIRPDYEIYLRHHLFITHELVLYAV